MLALRIGIVMQSQRTPTNPTASRNRPEPQTFPELAAIALGDPQLRHNLRNATHTIRTKRARVVAEMPDWEGLRLAGEAIKDRALRHLDHYLVELEAAVEARGGQVHWALGATEANAIVTGIIREAGAKAVVKSKSIATEEIELNDALAEAGIEAVETDLAELIVQLAGDTPSHILVPAIHFNRTQIQRLFKKKLAGAGVPGLDLDNLSSKPEDLTHAARLYLRHKFLNTRIGITGANFAAADTGTICLVESEGNGRMVATLPDVLITVMGIEKILPSWRDLEVFLQLLPRSATAERMNPYTSFWSGITPGDGPRAFHLVLLDNGRTDALRDQIGRQALRCIRCSACLNVCPVYERTGGHSYHSVYPGPIGAILTPQLLGIKANASLPYASSLCGACYEVCPVRINIPEVLVHLRGRVVREKQAEGGAVRSRDSERASLELLARVFASRRRYEEAQRLAWLGQGPLVRDGAIRWLPGELGGWTAGRDLPPLPAQTFREWWKEEHDRS